MNVRGRCSRGVLASLEEVEELAEEEAMLGGPVLMCYRHCIWAMQSWLGLRTQAYVNRCSGYQTGPLTPKILA